MAAWQTTFNGNLRTGLAAKLTAATVRVGPVSSTDADAMSSVTVICSTQRNWQSGESPTGTRAYAVDVFLGVLVPGMSDDSAVDDLWNALDLVEDAMWELLQPGTFRATNKIDSVVGISAAPVDSRVGTVRFTLRVRRD